MGNFKIDCRYKIDFNNQRNTYQTQLESLEIKWNSKDITIERVCELIYRHQVNDKNFIVPFMEISSEHRDGMTRIYHGKVISSGMNPQRQDEIGILNLERGTKEDFKQQPCITLGEDDIAVEIKEKLNTQGITHPGDVKNAIVVVVGVLYKTKDKEFVIRVDSPHAFHIVRGSEN